MLMREIPDRAETDEIIDEFKRTLNPIMRFMLKVPFLKRFVMLYIIVEMNNVTLTYVSRILKEHQRVIEALVTNSAVRDIIVTRIENDSGSGGGEFLN